MFALTLRRGQFDSDQAQTVIRILPKSAGLHLAFHDAHSHHGSHEQLRLCCSPVRVRAR
jgi:hypothetical protein